MKKNVLLFLLLFCLKPLFSETNLFFNIDYRNTISNDFIQHEIGANISIFFTKENPILFLNVGFDYDLTDDNKYKSEKQKKLDLENFKVFKYSIPFSLGYPINFKLYKNTNFYIIPLLKYEYNLQAETFNQNDKIYFADEEYYYSTNVTAIKNIHQFGAGLNVSMIHNFKNGKLNYGLDIGIPFWTIEDIKIKYKGFANGSTSDFDTYNIFSNYIMKISPFVGFGFSF